MSQYVLLLSYGLDNGLAGLGEGGAVGVISVELCVGGLGCVYVFQAAQGNDLTGKNLGNVIIF